MTIDSKFKTNTFLRYLGAGALALKLAGCTFTPAGLGPGHITGVDASTSPSDLDPKQRDGGLSDAGPCTYDLTQLPEMLFEPIYFDQNGQDLETAITNQRVPEGGLTLGQLFTGALDNGTVYTAAGFKLLYDNNASLRDALYADLSQKITDSTCAASETDKRATFDELIQQIFDDGDAPSDFQLRETNAIYAVSAKGNDNVTRNYLILVGQIVPAQGDQSGQSLVLYKIDMDQTVPALTDLSGGI